MRPETPLQPSPEQRALVDARRADPAGSLRVLAFAGAGKTTALRLLAEADPSPALYLAYNKAAQLQARARFPAHVACRTVHSLAFRATGMAAQRNRLERRPSNVASASGGYRRTARWRDTSQNRRSMSPWEGLTLPRYHATR